MARHGIERILLTGLVLLGVSCRSAPDLHPETLLPWLTCHECIDGELEAVLDLDREAVPGLLQALEGPSEDVVGAATSQFTAGWNRTARYLSGEGRRPPMSRADFVSASLSNFVATYRSRAAFALAEIGGSDARRALEDVVRDRAIDPPLRPDELDALQRAIARIDRGS